MATTHRSTCSEWARTHYRELKLLNPGMPIAMRPADGVSPYIAARFDNGVYRSTSTAGMDTNGRSCWGGGAAAMAAAVGGGRAGEDGPHGHLVLGAGWCYWASWRCGRLLGAATDAVSFLRALFVGPRCCFCAPGLDHCLL